MIYFFQLVLSKNVNPINTKSKSNPRKKLDRIYPCNKSIHFTSFFKLHSKNYFFQNLKQKKQRTKLMSESNNKGTVGNIINNTKQNWIANIFIDLYLQFCGIRNWN